MTGFASQSWLLCRVRLVAIYTVDSNIVFVAEPLSEILENKTAIRFFNSGFDTNPTTRKAKQDKGKVSIISTAL